eukprot:5469563-Prymnesium_polylepis.1
MISSSSSVRRSVPFDLSAADHLPCRLAMISIATDGSAAPITKNARKPLPRAEPEGTLAADKLGTASCAAELSLASWRIAVAAVEMVAVAMVAVAMVAVATLM